VPDSTAALIAAISRSLTRWILPLRNPAGDRAHEALQVDLNPHLGLGLPTVHRLELHSPARRGQAHRPGERQAAGRLDSGHVLAVVVVFPPKGDAGVVSDSQSSRGLRLV